MCLTNNKSLQIVSFMYVKYCKGVISVACEGPIIGQRAEDMMLKTDGKDKKPDGDR